MKPSHILSSVAVAGLFFLSGATGLVFEILWARMLGPWIGAGPATNALVIGAFMGGLAAGGLLAGRVRGKPLAAYGCAEVGVGLWGLATPSVMSALGPLFSGAFGLGETHAAACLALKGVATALLVVPPTILMGASFPLLARHARAGAAWLYAMNTAGAVLGSLFGGLILLPAIGASSTRIAASVLDIVIGFLALSLAMAIEPGSGQEEAQRNDGEAVGWQLLATIALWGAATMAGELACERTLALALGSSVYSLTFVVAAFIAGLAGGGAVFARLRPADTWLWLAAMGILAAVAVAAIVPVLGLMPAWMVPMVVTLAPHSFLALLAGQGLLLAFVLVPPAFVMGAGMPLACRLASRGGIGAVYAASTAGSIAGTLGAGLALIPLLGMRATLVVASALFLTAAAIALPRVASRGARRVCLAAALPAAALLAALPVWQTSLLTSGPFLYAGIYSKAARTTGKPVESLMGSFDHVLFHREGALATVTVREDAGGYRSLSINGKVDASTSLDMATQILVGHLPMTFAPRNPSVLLVGLGSGITLGAIETHEARSIECLELCPEVVEASRFFSRFNGDALQDRRLTLRIADATAHMKMSSGSYDVLCLEPSNPWVSGMAGMFTREHFQSCRERLSPRGVVCQWLQAYSLSPDDFKSVVRTFLEVFPEASLFEAIEGVDYLLLASKDGTPMTVASVEAALGRRPVRDSYAKAGVKGSIDLARRFVMGPAALRKFVSGAPVQVRDRALLEFTAPLSLYRDTGTELLAALEPCREGAETVLGTSSPAGALHLSRLPIARWARLAARSLAEQGKLAEADDLMGQVLAEFPDDESALDLRRQVRLEDARRAREREDFQATAERFERYLEAAPDDDDARNDLGVALAHLGLHDRAAVEYRKVLSRKPAHASALRNLGLAAYQGGHFQEAVDAYEQLRKLEPKDARVLGNLGMAYMKLDQYPQALERWHAALAFDPTLGSAREGIRMLDFLGYR